MRNKPPYACPQCGTPSAEPTTCDDCDLVMHDASGRPVALPYVSRRSLSSAGGGSLTLMLVFAVAFVGFVGFNMGGLFDALAAMTVVAGVGGFALLMWKRTHEETRFISDSERTKQLRRMQRSIAPSRIAEATSGCVRVRGTVHVIRGVEDDLAAVFRRVRNTHQWMVEVYRDGRHVREERSETTITDTTECGRFAIVDDTGVAIVDDDAFEIWSLTRKLARHHDGVLALRDGEQVEIIGPAAVGVAPEVAPLMREAPSGYRSGPSDAALLFDGTVDERVWIVVS